MNADMLIKKIEQKVQAEIEAIQKASGSKAKSLTEQFQREAEEEAGRIRNCAEAEAQKMYRQGLANTEQEAQIKLLEKKHIILKHFRTEAKNAMLSFSDAQWANFHTKLILDSKISGNMVLVVPGKDRRKYTDERFSAEYLPIDFEGNILQKWAYMLRVKQEKPCSIKLSEENAPFEGGFLISCQDYDIDLSYDAILDEIFEKHMQEIAHCIFAGEDEA